MQYKKFFSTIALALLTMPSYAAVTQVAVGNYNPVKHIYKSFSLSIPNRGLLWQFNDDISIPNGDMPQITDIACSESYCISVGTYNNAEENLAPLILQSSNHGKSWLFSKGLPTDSKGSLTTVSCHGNLCATAGNTPTGSNYDTLPVLYTSNNKGKTWASQNIAGLPEIKNGTINQLRCYLSDCVAIGTGTTMQAKEIPLMLSSTNSGQSWSYVNNIDHLPELKSPKLSALTCYGKICLAGGVWGKSSPFPSPGSKPRQPLLLRSEDHGQSWSYVDNIANLPSDTDFGVLKLACTTENDCIALSASNNMGGGGLNSLEVLTTHDSGKSWSRTTHFPGTWEDNAYSYFDAMACSGEMCVIAGRRGGEEKGHSYHLPMLVTQNSGRTWALVKNVKGAERISAAEIHTIQCKDDHCVAVGVNRSTANLHPMIVQSHDRGVTWQASTLLRSATAFKTTAMSM